MKKKKWKKVVSIIIGIIVILIAVIILLPSFLNLFAKDIPPINDSDILLKKVIVADSQNAYFDLLKVQNTICEPEGKSELLDKMKTGKAWDEVVAEEIVSQNIEASKYFAQAAGKPKFKNPAFADPANISPNTIFPSMNTWSKMVRFSAIRALYLAKQGRDKEAMEEALNLVRIGQKIQESQSLSVMKYLLGVSMKTVGLETVQRIIASSKLSSSELTSYAQELNDYYKNEDGLIKSFKSEYHIQSQIIDILVSGDKEELEGIINIDEIEKIKNNFYFQPNKTKLLFAEHIRANIRSVNQPCGEIKAIEAPNLAPTNPIAMRFEENAIGKILYDVGAANLTNMIIIKCKEDLLVAATQTLLAIKAYSNDNGNHPTSLNDLVPHYISSVPIDPFDGKALKYSYAKKIVYSVGPDLHDSGGSTGDDWRKMSDPTFKIDF